MPNILYISQFFSLESEPGGQGQRHYKHVMGLARAGHQVTVMTTGSTTMHSDGPIASDAETSQLHPNINLVRIPTPPMTHRSVVSRALRYFHFSTMTLLAGVSLIVSKRQNYQFVLGSSPPLLVGLVACFLAMLARASFYFEIRDLWSQTMAANGFIKHPLLLWLNRALETFLYAQSDRLIVLSPAFKEVIRHQAGCREEKITFIPNAADLEFYQTPQLWSGSYLKPEASQSGSQPYNVIYAGVFSDYTKLDVLIDAAEIIRNQYPEYGHIQFHLAGGGYHLPALKNRVNDKKLENVRFWSALPKNRISRFITEGDLSIINYRALDVFSQVLPNKLFEYLAAGRPILACVPPGEISAILDESGAGVSIAAEDPHALAEKIVWFCQNRGKATQMGLAGKAYVQRHFNRAKMVADFLNLFPRVLAAKQQKKSERLLEVQTSDKQHLQQ